MSSVRDIPSQVTKSHWVWARQKSQESVSPNRIGKWMVFLDIKKQDPNGLTELDRAWFSLITLVEEKVLHGAKCSTAMTAGDKDTGVIISYTADYTDLTKVREAAEAIHRIITLKGPMYYKTDEATYSGKYVHLGHKNVSMYRFCPDLTFYKRGANRSSWVQILSEPCGSKEICLSH